MARYIDADIMREDWLENGENEYVYDTNAVLDSIDSQPTADVVEVVRCKDCKHCDHCYPSKPKDGDAVEGWYCNLSRGWRKPDDFCSCGERKQKNDLGSDTNG